jgi:hypothetical protein
MCSCNVFVVSPEPAKTWIAKQSVLVNNTEYLIDPGLYAKIPVTVTMSSDIRNVHITGSFDAAGGANDDVDAYVLDAAGYDDFVAGSAVVPMYFASRATTGSFDVRISSSGLYYVVFDNGFSVVSQKSVYVTVDQTWEQYE